MIAPGFTGSPLDRMDAARHDPARVAAMRADPAARLLRLDGLAPCLTEARTLDWLPVAAAPAERELVLLGAIDGVPHFAALEPGVSGFARSSELFMAIADLAAGEAATYAAARSLIDWHARHGFCARCGHATALFRAGWGRRCSACDAEHFPRVDPVVIMLAEHGGRVLVGRQAAFPPGRYSALAGFVEPGESVEEAVARELFEEAGVRAARVRYVASQPWPFPSQLMIACIAEVADDALTIDYSELEAAMWVDRAAVDAAMRRAPDGAFLPPPPFAIANTLFTHWLAETETVPV